jgi:hypothetical protein
MQSVVSDVCHSSPSDEDEENEFYDAQDEACSQNTDADFILKIPLGHRRNSSGLSFGSQVGFYCYGCSTAFFIFCALFVCTENLLVIWKFFVDYISFIYEIAVRSVASHPC